MGAARAARGPRVPPGRGPSAPARTPACDARCRGVGRGPPGNREGGSAMFDRMVVAVDGSGCSDRAVLVAAELAGAFGSEVVVVHVAPEIVGWGIAVEAESPDEASDVADRAVRELKDRGLSARP